MRPRYRIRRGATPSHGKQLRQQDVVQRWLDVGMFDEAPLNRRLSGLPLEYRVIELFSRDTGKREAKLAFDVGQGTQDLGFRNEVNLLFDCRPCVAVRLGVLDSDGTPTTGHFKFRDARGRVYPARSRRLAPDFFFHDQVYRQDGETILLPAGKYHVVYTRGPEYRVLERDIEVPARHDARRDIPHGAVDQSGGGRLVFGRSPRPRGRLCPLRVADPGRRAERHDAPHRGRRPQRRLRADLGTMLVSCRSRTSMAR